MALRAVIDHPKFARLKNILKLNKACTLGYLEGLWHFCGRYTPNGNIGKYSAEDIEAWLEWDGEDGALIAAMVKAKWIDDCPVNGLIVHDWHKHADDATRLALKRAKQEFVVATESVSVPRCPDSVATGSGLPEPGAGAVPGAEPESARDAENVKWVDPPAVQCLNQLKVLACVQNCKNQDDAGQVLLLENLIGRVKLEFPPGEEWPYWAGWVASRASSKAVYTSATSSQTAAAVLERFLPDIQAEIKRRNANRQALGDDFGKPKEPERKLGRDYLIDPVTGEEVPTPAVLA
jgi:hypothetical protein